MSVTSGPGSEPDSEPDRTLEERLYAAHDRFALLVDVFDLQGAGRSGRPGSLPTPAPHRSGRAGCRDRSWARAPVGEE